MQLLWVTFPLIFDSVYNLISQQQILASTRQQDTLTTGCYTLLTVKGKGKSKKTKTKKTSSNSQKRKSHQKSPGSVFLLDGHAIKKTGRNVNMLKDAHDGTATRLPGGCYGDAWTLWQRVQRRNTTMVRTYAGNTTAAAPWRGCWLGF